MLFTVATTNARADSWQSSANGTLAARLSDADGAMEYWDVTAWLDSGERFSARFLLTNQGPGDRTAAAVGHLVRATGEVLPFKWGRRRDAWTLGADGRRLEIAKATLDVSGPTIVVDVDSRKHGVQVHLDVERPLPHLVKEKTTPYTFEVVMPSPARAVFGARGASDDVVGSAAATHTWTSRPESELIRRRDELLARQGERSLYFTSLVTPDGERHSTWIEQRLGSESGGSGTIIAMSDITTLGGDVRYPVAAEWTITAGDVRYAAELDRELLRMNPLEILPQPFRFLLSLGGAPHRVWADATIQRTFTPLRASSPKQAPTPTEMHGIAVSTFAGPE